MDGVTVYALLEGIGLAETLPDAGARPDSLPWIENSRAAIVGYLSVGDYRKAVCSAQWCVQQAHTWLDSSKHDPKRAVIGRRLWETLALVGVATELESLPDRSVLQPLRSVQKRLKGLGYAC